MEALLKIAKPGKNIPDITDDRDYIFNSELDYLKETQSGIVDTDVNGDVTITHNLGYVPAFTVFCADATDLTTWFPYDAFGDVYATSTQLVIIGAGAMVQSKVYYSIFSSAL